jgi:uncharacterized protein (TIGR02284 family)
MTQSAANLNELIQIARDGQTFYTDAIGKVRNPNLRVVFRGIIDAKAQLIAALSEHVRVRGQLPSDAGTLTGYFHQLYGDISATLSRDSDAAFVPRLEEAEDRLLSAFENAAAASENRDVRDIVLRHLPRVRLCHEQMRNLRISLAA